MFFEELSMAPLLLMCLSASLLHRLYRSLCV